MRKLLCEMGFHDWSRWEMGTSTRWDGMKPREVSDQRRSCIWCSYAQVVLIKPKVK